MKSIKDYVGVFDGVVPPEVCARIIKRCDEIGWEKSRFASIEQPLDASDPYVDMKERHVQDPDLRQEVNHYFSEAARHYVDLHKDAWVMKLSVPKVCCYEAPEGFMRRHVDLIYHSHGQEYGYPVLTCSIMLNSDFEGGEFILFDGEYRIKATTGQAILFPSNFMFPHEIGKVRQGKRYSLVAWYL
jgi:predicted 2-oxoglutarate/Fe(II)-dependent dioxygenase YbiX